MQIKFLCQEVCVVLIFVVDKPYLWLPNRRLLFPLTNMKGSLLTFIEHVSLCTKVSYLLNKLCSSVDATVIATVSLALQPLSIYASSHRQFKFGAGVLTKVSTMSIS